MKVKTVMLLSILLVCVGLSYVAAESSEFPDLVGTWTGNSVGHYMVDGFTNETAFNYEFIVTEQQGPVFTGTLYETGIHGNVSYGFSGVLDHDMKTLYIADHDKGYNTGHLISADEMELILLVDGGKALAEVCTLKKV